MNAMPLALEGRRLVLGVDAAHEALAIDATLSRLGDALARTLGVPGLEVAVRKADLAADSPAARARRAAEAEQRALEAIVEGDPFVQQIKREFGGRVVAGSIRPNRPE